MNPYKPTSLSGVWTALVTPFLNGRIDEATLRQLVDWQIESGINGLVACGTTGESATLSTEEKKSLIEIVIDQAKNRVPVMAGTGTNNTKESVELTQWAKSAGATAALVVTPYYNKPSQEGLFRHYTELARLNMPLVLYNVPGRTGVSLSLDTIKRLAENPNVVALKEASGDMNFASEIIRSISSEITVLSGDDFTFLPLLSLGGNGIISVASHVIPHPLKELYESFQIGDIGTARRIYLKIYPLINALFLETNPVPVKTALAWMHKIHLEFRLPLCEMRKENLAKLENTLHSLELI